jgi:hypothetical protein
MRSIAFEGMPCARPRAAPHAWGRSRPVGGSYRMPSDHIGAILGIVPNDAHLSGGADNLPMMTCPPLLLAGLSGTAPYAQTLVLVFHDRDMLATTPAQLPAPAEATLGVGRFHRDV